jgi:putative phosphoesterase
VTAQRKQSAKQGGLLARIGVISDTHGLFDDAIRGHFAGVEHIVHAGDIGRPSVIDRLETIAPVTAVSGNVDGFEASGFPREAVITIAGRRIALFHRLYEGGTMTAEGRAFLDRAGADVCVFGHTHKPMAERLDGMWLFNPGSAGPKRFTLPRGIGLLLLYRDTIEPVHIVLPDRAESCLD